MARLMVNHWGDFQHYKHRSPPWIKLHKKLLDNYDYQCLPLASRALAPMLWLLASESDDGSIEFDLTKLAFRLRTSEHDVKEALIPLICKEFLIDDCGLLAECLQDDSEMLLQSRVEESREEKSSMSGEQEKEEKSQKSESTKEQAIEILEFLNSKAKRNYRPTDVNLELIRARLKEKYSVQDCKQVIAKKCREWMPDDKMREYLRPATLFNREKFNQYIGEIVEEE